MWDSFDTPGWIIFFTALGAIFLWFKENAASAKSGQAPRNLRVFALADLLDRFNLSENVRWGLQLSIFVALGTVVALAEDVRNSVETSDSPQVVVYAARA